MIDFHSHILPNIDDGSRSIEETFDLIKEAEEVGFDSIISTSHYIENYYEVNSAERQIWIDAISKALKQKNIAVKLYLGNEVYFTHNIIELLLKRKIVTMNKSNYMLFEFPLNAKPLHIEEVIFELMEHKIIPILAHPERYSFVQEKPDMIPSLIESGVLMQSNYGSILGLYGEKAKILVKKFLECNMIQFLGSDVHRHKSIYPKIPTMIEEIKKIVGEEKIKELTTTNPQSVLDNEKIETEDPKEMKFSFKEKLILHSKN